MNKKSSYIIFLFISCFFANMCLFNVIEDHFYMKSIINFICLFLLPYVLLKVDYQNDISHIFKAEGLSAFKSFSIGVIIFIFIYFLSKLCDQVLGNYFLKKYIGTINKEQVTKLMFYAIVNTFTIEFFFRGVGYLHLRRYCSDAFAAAFSSFCFGIYFYSNIIKRRSFPLFIFSMFILMGVSIVLNRTNLNEFEKDNIYKDGNNFEIQKAKNGVNNFYNSWLIHMSILLAIGALAYVP